MTNNKNIDLPKINQLIEKLNTKPSLNSMSYFVKIFRLIIKEDDEIQNEEKEDLQYNSEQTKIQSNFIIEDPEALDKILRFGLGSLPQIFKTYLNLEVPLKTIKNKKQEILLKVYLYNLYKFYRQVHEEDMNLFILKYLPEISDFLYPFKVLFNKFLMHTIDLWASHDSMKIKLYSFILIRRIAINCDEKTQEMIFRCELLSANFQTAYLVAFSYIRQLGVHLKTQTAEKKPDSEKFVYNWEIINSLRLWALAVCKYNKEDQLYQLIYPLIEIIQGYINYNSSFIFVPTHLHLIRILLAIQEKTQIYIPVTNYLKNLLKINEFRNKKVKSSIKPFEFHLELKVDKKYKKTNIFWNEVFKEIVSLFALSLSVFSRDVSFPEIAYNIIKYLKRVQKELRFIIYKMELKDLITKIETDVSTVIKSRLKIDFGPSKIKQSNLFSDNHMKNIQQTNLEKLRTVIMTERDQDLKQKILAEKEDYYEEKEVSDSGEDKNQDENENEEQEQEEDDNEDQNEEDNSYDVEQDVSSQNSEENDKDEDLDIDNMNYEGDPDEEQVEQMFEEDENQDNQY